MNINLNGDKVYTPNDSLEPGSIFGTGLAFETLEAIPVNLRYPGKVITNKDTGDQYSIGIDGETATLFHTLTDAEMSKLSGIEAGAEVNPSGVEIKAAYEGEDDTNAFTDAEKSKLSGIETSAEVNPTGAEIKAAYEGEDDTNAYTDAEKSKLSGIEEGAEVNPTGAEIKSALNSESDTNTLTDAELAKVNNSAQIVSSSFTGIHVLTQAEYDAIGTPTATVLYLIKPA